MERAGIACEVEPGDEQLLKEEVLWTSSPSASCYSTATAVWTPDDEQRPAAVYDYGCRQEPLPQGQRLGLGHRH